MLPENGGNSKRFLNKQSGCANQSSFAVSRTGLRREQLDETAERGREHTYNGASSSYHAVSMYYPGAKYHISQM